MVSPAVEKIPTRRVRWQATYRIVSSRFPPIALFERVAPPESWEALIALEGLTNPRLRDDAGEISLVPPDQRVSGPGASIVMAPFTHVSRDRPTRFSDGSYGVYYAAREFETALQEVRFHMTRFYNATDEGPLRADFRTYQGSLDKTMHDLTRGNWKVFLDPDVRNYATSQAAGKTLRENGSNGLVYPSVRNKDGQCLAAFRPDAVPIPKPTTHIQFNWNGQRISQWFNYDTSEWMDL